MLMVARGGKANIETAIKRFLKENPPPEGVDEELVLGILKVMEDYQFSIDRSRARDLIRRIVEGRR